MGAVKRQQAAQPLDGTHNLGARIRALRVGGGLTQAQLADTVRIAPETMSRIERGKLRPSPRLIELFATALGANPQNIFEQTTVRPPVPDLRPVDRKLLYEVRNMPDELVESLIRVVRLLVEVGRNMPGKGRVKDTHS
jgi:transcriptional regulator with XRE-family HTH domain